MSDLNQFSRPLIIAHRGASAIAPENTIAAFTKAVSLGADMVEMDLKLTSDQEVVIIHDRTVDRTTNGSGEVKQFTFKNIQMLDAGARFSPGFAGEKIPSLRDVCGDLKGKILLNLELTNYASFLDALPQKVAQIISEYEMQEEVLISSFNVFNLIRFHKYMPGVQLALLIDSVRWARLLSNIFGGRFAINSIHPHFSMLNTNTLREYRKHYSRIHPWTVNKLEEMKTMLDFRVDGIITDYPEIARGLILFDN